jgi:DNA-binding transcriptional regulator YiaG
MPNIAAVFKAEMSRIARKELRFEVEPLKKQLASQRAAMAALRRQLQASERRVAAALKQSGRVAVRGKAAAIEERDDPRFRFSAKGFATHRQRLGISAADMAKLLGVSQLSVYKWEGGKTRPREKQLAAIAAVRKLGKREVTQRLEELA